MDQQRIDEINRQIDEAISYGPDLAISWLRTAFHSHEQNIETVRERNKELRKALLARIKGALTVPEARMCGVCRICRGDWTQYQKDKTLLFVFNCGEEFAHQSCLDRVKKATDECIGEVKIMYMKPEADKGE